MCLANSGSGGGEDLHIGHGVQQGGKAPQGIQGLLDAVGRQAARFGQAAPQAGKDFFVVDCPDSPAFQAIDHQADRVRPHINDSAVAGDAPGGKARGRS